MLLLNILIKQAFLSSEKLGKISFQSLCSMIIHFITQGTIIKNMSVTPLTQYHLVQQERLLDFLMRDG